MTDFWRPTGVPLLVITRGNLALYWPRTLWLNTVTSLAVGLECAVLISMVGQHLTWMSRPGYVTSFGTLQPSRVRKHLVKGYASSFGTVQT